MSKYQPTIGLEIHVILKTRTKMFCDSLNDLEEKEPNKNVCPVCLGHPGALPTINKKAVESVIRVGLALGGTISRNAKFDRKNYFYPDLPKGYQISQFDEPFVLGGQLHGVRVRRVHLEEDAGRLIHEGSPSTGHSILRASDPMGSGRRASLVDFNRAGVPLMELVTEPDIKSAEQAVEFAKGLQQILRYLDVSDADMEKGQMRVEANISVSANDAMGTKVEVKNLNSFKAVEGAIRYELTRQEEILEKGEAVAQETRGWDDGKQKTLSQRSKEEAHDYRYFPEPDLPPIDTARAFDLAALRASLPELPADKEERFQREFGLTAKQAAALTADIRLANFFEEAVSELATRDERTTSRVEKKSQELLFNYLTSDLAGLMNEKGVGFTNLKIEPEELAHLVDLITDGKIMSRQAKDILANMFETGEDPETIMKNEGLETVSDEGEIEQMVKEVLAENPVAVADYKKGKAASMQFLIGKAMAKLRGRGSPETLRDMFEKNMK